MIVCAVMSEDKKPAKKVAAKKEAAKKPVGRPRKNPDATQKDPAKKAAPVKKAAPKKTAAKKVAPKTEPITQETPAIDPLLADGPPHPTPKVVRVEDVTTRSVRERMIRWFKRR